MRVLQHIRMGVVVPMKRETKLRRTWESNRSNMPVVKGHHARQSGRRGRGGGATAAPTMGLRNRGFVA